MIEIQIACIVKGHGEIEAVPIVVRRIALEADPTLVLHIPPPIRVPKSKLLKLGELERAVELAARKLGGTGAVLIVLDSDDDCPAELGPRLYIRAAKARSDVPLAVVLAKPEFESWFLASVATLRGLRGLPEDLQPPTNPEAVRGAKEWLASRMMGRHMYTETLDQPAFAARLDLGLARQADSFDKCYREITRLVTELRGA